jgi:hypothetical protein
MAPCKKNYITIAHNQYSKIKTSLIKVLLCRKDKINSQNFGCFLAATGAYFFSLELGNKHSARRKIAQASRASLPLSFRWHYREVSYVVSSQGHRGLSSVFDDYKNI